MTGWGGARPGAGRKPNPICVARIGRLKSELWKKQKETGKPWEKNLIEMAYLPIGTPEEKETNGILKATALKLISELVVDGKGDFALKINL